MSPIYLTSSSYKFQRPSFFRQKITRWVNAEFHFSGISSWKIKWIKYKFLHYCNTCCSRPGPFWRWSIGILRVKKEKFLGVGWYLLVDISGRRQRAYLACAILTSAGGTGYRSRNFMKNTNIKYFSQFKIFIFLLSFLSTLNVFLFHVQSLKRIQIRNRKHLLFWNHMLTGQSGF